MSTFVFYGYSAASFVFDPSTGTFTLDPDYTRSDRIKFEVTDDDRFLDGDEHNNEVGEDRNQSGTVTDSQGQVIANGLIYGEQRGFLRAPDGSTVSIDRIEIAGQLIGYMPSEPLQPGATYTYVGGEDIDNMLGGRNGRDTRKSYAEYERTSVPCFGPGTMIATQEGEVPVEWLAPGDRVLTRDHGFQPILWIGRTSLPRGYFDQFPEDAPVRIPAGALGHGPSHDLQVTGDHRLLIRSPLAEALFFESEVLAPAKAWVDAGQAERVCPAGDYTLTHILCAQHEVLLAQGAWVESLFLGSQTLARMTPADAERVRDLAGPDALTMPMARMCLTRREARLLLGQPAGKRREMPSDLLARSA